MLLRPRHMLFLGLLCCCLPAHAQIYSCEGPNGTRVFSDRKCGPDAQTVKGISTNSKPPPPSVPKPKPKAAPKSSVELQELMKKCNAGDMSACTTWTHGGGPADLREQERQAEAACNEGSLPDCELRFCSDGATAECRERVMGSAQVSGGNWYLREDAQQEDGSILYKVRCIFKGMIEMRDTTIACSIDPGPQRCHPSNSDAGYARLDVAAANFCADPRTR